jgi:hypothetical protein
MCVLLKVIKMGLEGILSFCAGNIGPMLQIMGIMKVLKDDNLMGACSLIYIAGHVLSQYSTYYFSRTHAYEQIKTN